MKHTLSTLVLAAEMGIAGCGGIDVRTPEERARAAEKAEVDRQIRELEEKMKAVEAGVQSCISTFGKEIRICQPELSVFCVSEKRAGYVTCLDEVIPSASEIGHCDPFKDAQNICHAAFSTATGYDENAQTSCSNDVAMVVRKCELYSQ